MAMQNYKPGKAAFIFIFITVALDMIALGRDGPRAAEADRRPSRAAIIGSASRMVGYFGIAWAFMQFVFQPILGALSDRFGRRPVVLLSNLGLGLDYVVMALAPNLGLAVPRPADLRRRLRQLLDRQRLYRRHHAARKNAPPRFGMLGGAFGLGFVLGPAIGGCLGQIDLRLPFWGAAGLSLLNALYGFFVLPESLAPENRTKTLRLEDRPCPRLAALPLARTDFGPAGRGDLPVLSRP